MLKATYTSNWGKFFVKEESIYYNRPWQMSLAFEIQLGRKITDLPLNFCIGFYGDFGKLYSNCAGLTLRLTYADSWKR